MVLSARGVSVNCPFLTRLPMVDPRICLGELTAPSFPVARVLGSCFWPSIAAERWKVEDPGPELMEHGRLFCHEN